MFSKIHLDITITTAEQHYKIFIKYGNYPHKKKKNRMKQTTSKIEIEKREGEKNPIGLDYWNRNIIVACLTSSRSCAIILALQLTPLPHPLRVFPREQIRVFCRNNQGIIIVVTFPHYSIITGTCYYSTATAAVRGTHPLALLTHSLIIHCCILQFSRIHRWKGYLALSVVCLGWAISKEGWLRR